MGNDSRLRSVGGRADSGPACRFRDRCRLGPLHPVARDLAPPPGGAHATASVVPPGGLRKALRIEPDSALEGRGFEPPVPLAKRVGLSGGTGSVAEAKRAVPRASSILWDRGFESFRRRIS